MLVACRLASLSALETYYAGVRAHAMRGGRDQPSPPLRQQIREAKLVERLAEEMAEDNGSARVAPARPAR